MSKRSRLFVLSLLLLTLLLPRAAVAASHADEREASSWLQEALAWLAPLIDPLPGEDPGAGATADARLGIDPWG